MNMTGVVGPANIPASIVERIHQVVIYAIGQNKDYLVSNA